VSAINAYLILCAAAAIQQAANANSHCRGGIARTVGQLGRHLECAEHQYDFPKEGPNNHADLKSEQVVQK